MQESDPRVLLEPNFYYAQEDILWEWCRQRSVSWNIAMPSYIVGAVSVTVVDPKLATIQLTLNRFLTLR